MHQAQNHCPQQEVQDTRHLGNIWPPHHLGMVHGVQLAHAEVYAKPTMVSGTLLVLTLANKHSPTPISLCMPPCGGLALPWCFLVKWWPDKAHLRDIWAAVVFCSMSVDSLFVLPLLAPSVLFLALHAGNTPCRFFILRWGDFFVPFPTGGRCCVVVCVWAPAPFSCFLVGFLVLFPCVSRYALLARGSAFRLYAACFLCESAASTCTAMGFFIYILVQT